MDSTSTITVAGQNIERKLMKPNVISREFVRQYYTVLSRSPQNLHHFYHKDAIYLHDDIDPNSTAISLEGKAAITAMLESAGFSYRNCFTRIHHMTTTETLNNGLLIQIVGEILNDGESQLRRFSQSFILMAAAPLKYFVTNDIFRYDDQAPCELMDNTMNNITQNDSMPVFDATGAEAFPAPDSAVAHTIAADELASQSPLNGENIHCAEHEQQTMESPQPVEVKIKILARGQTIADVQSDMDKCTIEKAQLTVAPKENDAQSMDYSHLMTPTDSRYETSFSEVTTIIDLTMDSDTDVSSHEDFDVDKNSTMVHANDENKMLDSKLENEMNADESNDSAMVDEAIVIDSNVTSTNSESETGPDSKSHLNSDQTEPSILNSSDSVLGNRKKAPKKSLNKQMETKKSYADHLKTLDKDTKLNFVDETPSALSTSTTSGSKFSNSWTLANVTAKSKGDSFSYAERSFSSNIRKSSLPKGST